MRPIRFLLALVDFIAGTLKAWSSEDGMAATIDRISAGIASASAVTFLYKGTPRWFRSDGFREPGVGELRGGRRVAG